MGAPTLFAIGILLLIALHAGLRLTRAWSRPRGPAVGHLARAPRLREGHPARLGARVATIVTASLLALFAPTLAAPPHSGPPLLEARPAALLGTSAPTTLSATMNSRIDKQTPTTHTCCLTTLRADADDYDSLIRFDLSGISGVTQATLRMYVAEGGQPVQLRDTTSAWSESTVTWSTAPAAGGLAGTFPISTAGTWVTADVTAAVAAGIGDFRLTSVYSDGVSFNGRLTSTNQPQLILTLVGQSPSPSPSPSSSPSPSPSPTAFVTATPSPTPTPSPSPTPTVVPSPSPTPTPSPSQASSISHVVIVWLENHEYGSVTSTSMPYLTSLAAQYGLATNYDAVSHPSLPNYLALWSGSTLGVLDDETYNLRAASLSTQFQNAGFNWRAFEQNYPATAGCHTGSSYSGGVDDGGVAGTYARRHDPAMSFTSVGGANCANILPLDAYSGAANLIFVTPNLCNDAHDCSLTQADNFLKAFSPQVFGSADWAHTLYIVTFDEGTSGTGGGGQVYTMVARAGMGHLASNAFHNHYGLTRTVEDIFGLPCLANACNAAPLTEFLP
jgi:hypothetical protein